LKKRILVFWAGCLLLSACGNTQNVEERIAAEMQNMSQTEGSGSQQESKAVDFDGEIITTDQIEQYQIASRGRWGNLALGVSYNIPNSEAPTDQVVSIYPHGHSFFYYDNYMMFVEGLLNEESYTLETLYEQIGLQKQNEKYGGFYEFVTTLKDQKPKKIERVDVNGREAVYFECEIPPEEGKEDSSITVLGYSFEFEGKPLCIYTFYTEKQQNFFTNESHTLEDIKHFIIYMIDSMENYDGSTFEAMDKQGNFYKSFGAMVHAEDNEGDNFLSKSVRYPGNDDARNILFFAMKNWIGNGIYSGAGSGHNDLLYPYTYLKEEGEDKRKEFLMKKDLQLDDIFPAAKDEEYLFVIGKPEILKEEMVELSGIEFKKMVVALSGSDGVVSSYAVYYSFFLDETPYIWRIGLNASRDQVKEMDAQTKELYLQTTELVADTLVRTIRIAPKGVDLYSLIIDNIYHPNENPIDY